MEDRVSRIRFIVISMILYIALYIILKIFIVFVDDFYRQKDINNKTYGVGNVLKINSYSEEEKQSTSYFTSNSNIYKIQLKDYLNGFEEGESDKNFEYHMLYDETNQIKAGFMMGVFPTRVDNINSRDSDSFYHQFDYFPLYISEALRNSFLKKYNIKNDIDLIKVIRERKKINSNFLTPIVDIKENSFFNFIEADLPHLEKITYIEGDLSGYMYEENDYKQACILKNKKMYCLSFYRLDYFKDETITDILRSLIIEK